MRRNAAQLVRFGAGLAGLTVLGWVLSGEAAPPLQRALPTDWSTRHLVFSRPGTAEQVRRVTQDPRYWQQWFRQNVSRVLSNGESGASDAPALQLGSSLSAGFTRMHRDWSENLGTGGGIGAINFPVKFPFSNTSASCTDFVVFSTGLQSSTTQASIIAYSNLYSSGCTNPVPSTYWAFDTTNGTVAGTIDTSPVLSRDGSQVAFVQTDGLGHASLVLLRWKANSGTRGSPVRPSSVAASTYTNASGNTACLPLPCMVAFPLRNGTGNQTDDTTSSIFYDYNPGSDTAWVGDSSGLLHKFHPVFASTPAEVRTAPWPVQVNSSNATALDSPIYDSGSGNIFVGDLGGFVERVIASTGIAIVSGQIDHGTGLVESPSVDSTASLVYVFSSNDGGATCGGPCAAVFLLGTNFAANATGKEIAVGASSASPNPLYFGDFDSKYQNSSNATGNLYVCGKTGGIPTLYQVPIKAGVMSAAVTGPALASAATGCSPVTDVINPNSAGGGSEWIFASTQANGVGSCAGSGCIMNFVVAPWAASQKYVANQEILDTHFQVQVVNVASGTSGTTTPAWSIAVGGATTDGSVTWYNQGPYTAAPAAWKASTGYPKGTEVVDTHNNVEVQTKTGTPVSGTTTPVWCTTGLGCPTIEPGAGPHWTNLGPVASNGLKAAGGTSGIIIDNVVGSVQLAGASQVYYSTLTDQACTTGGTGGCAVQASQPALK